MEEKYNRRVYRSSNCNSDDLSNLLYRRNPLSTLRNIRESTLKHSIIPIAVASTTFLTGFANKAHAEVFKKNADTYKNPTDWSLSGIGEDIMQMPQGVIDVFEGLANLINWFKELPDNVKDYTFTFTDQVYNLISALIIKTPLWIFDNSWFENTTYIFSVASIGVVSVLTIIEAIKKMFKHKTMKIRKVMDIKTIAKRWFIVAGLSSVAPVIFKTSFQILNWFSEKIISLSSGNMASMLNQSTNGFDVFVLILFNIVLLGVSVPIILKNARRFWDILMLTCCSPVIATTYIFDSHHHYFNQWWRNLKHLSLVQLVYAFFLLMIGLVVYGVPTPEDTTGQIIKLLMIVGGFYRLADPPRFVKEHLDSGGEITEKFKDIDRKRKGLVKNVKEGFDIARSPVKGIQKVNSYVKNEPQIVTSSPVEIPKVKYQSKDYNQILKERHNNKPKK